MKREIKPRDRQEVRRQFPLADLIPGWFFRVRELSVGHYCVDGTDLFGRTVSRSGEDPDALMDRCKTDAQAILDTPRASD